MDELSRVATDLRHAADPVTFACEALRFIPDPWQCRVLRSTTRRGIWNCSRQSGKSVTAAIVALHGAIFRPGSLILLVSPTERQSKELFAKVMDFLKSLEVLPELEEDNKQSLKLANKSRVVSLPGSPTTVRGYSAPGLVVVDEAAFCPDALFSAVTPMLAASKGRLILISTPNGKQGFYHQAWTDEESDWEKVRVPASQCPRIAPEYLQFEKRKMGKYKFSQEYECAFVEMADALFRDADIRGMVDPDVQPLFAAGALANDRKIVPLFKKSAVA